VRPVRVVQPAGVVDRNVLPGGGDGTVPHSAVRDLQARDVVHTVHLAIELSGHRVIRAGRSVSHRTGAAYQLTRLFSYAMVRISFPMCMLDSMPRCAAAASRSGNVAWMTGLTAPDSMSGQRCSWTARAIAPLSATGRARSVEPVIVSRRCM